MAYGFLVTINEQIKIICKDILYNKLSKTWFTEITFTWRLFTWLLIKRANTLHNLFLIAYIYNNEL